jgi:hypothetical protein
MMRYVGGERERERGRGREGGKLEKTREILKRECNYIEFRFSY